MPLLVSTVNPNGNNRKVTKEQLDRIRSLDDFDLIMLISELHDFGWNVAARTLEMMPTPTRKKSELEHRIKELQKEIDRLLMIHEGLKQ